MDICMHQGEMRPKEKKGFGDFQMSFSLFFLPLLCRSVPQRTGGWLLHPAGLPVGPEACSPWALPAGLPDSRGHLHLSR